jgi:hypothetical protein
LNVYEIRKGSTGNDREDDADLANLEFTLTHDTATGADSSALMIGMYETQTISCSSTTWNAAAVATISFGDKSTTTTVDISLADLQTKLETDLGTGTVSVTADSSETQLCENGASNIIKIAFTGTKFTVPTFEISVDDSAFTITPGILVDGVDSVTYISDGLYTIEYTPTIKGHYAADVAVSGTSILTDLSAGVTVYPAAASGPQTTHSSSWFEMEDVTATFAIQATDRFGNELDGSLTAGTDFSVQLVGSPDPCSGVSSGDSFFASITESTPNTDGTYTVSYLPRLAGPHLANIQLRSVGGLLATYYKNVDFTNPVLGNNDHLEFPYHEIKWCPDELKTCDSTRLDSTVSFDWGNAAPLTAATSADFPMDYFSVSWVGEILAPSTDTFTFTLTTDNKVRLTIDGTVVIDGMSTSAAINTGTISLISGTFYSIKVDYVEDDAEASVDLQYSTSTVASTTVPSTMLYYSRHIGDASTGLPTGSPLPITFVPGAVDVTSTASGSGLTDCVATNACTFTIQAKDSHGNNRYNSDSDRSNWVLSLTGTGDWALDGRTNDIFPYAGSPISYSRGSGIVDITNPSSLGTAYVTHGAYSITTIADLTSSVNRGDKIIIGGVAYTVSEDVSDIFDASNLPLASWYLGPTVQTPDPALDVYAGSSDCSVGTHLVTYTPNVRGTYQLDVKVPMVSEVQSIKTSAATGATLSGSFTLSFTDASGTETSSAINFNDDATNFENAVASVSNLAGSDIEVNLGSCAAPTTSCEWLVTFNGRPNSEGNIAEFVPTSSLGGNGATIEVTEVTRGVEALSIDGAPFTVDVVPDETDASFTTAFGAGLVAGTAGVPASFTIQAKDDYGNDRLSSQPDDVFAVLAFPEAGEAPEASTAVYGTVASIGDGQYSVTYTPT